MSVAKAIKKSKSSPKQPVKADSAIQQALQVAKASGKSLKSLKIKLKFKDGKGKE